MVVGRRNEGDVRRLNIVISKWDQWSNKFFLSCMVDKLGFVSRLADGDESVLTLYASRCFGALRPAK